MYKVFEVSDYGDEKFYEKISSYRTKKEADEDCEKLNKNPYKRRLKNGACVEYCVMGISEYIEAISNKAYCLLEERYGDDFEFQDGDTFVFRIAGGVLIFSFENGTLTRTLSGNEAFDMEDVDFVKFKSEN